MRRAAWTAMLAVLISTCACTERDVTVKERPVVVVSESSGSGRPAKAGDLVTIAYRAELPDGQEILRDNDYTFELGAGTVILAIEEAVNGMRVGGRRVIEAPPQKHWGRAGYGNGVIPPNTRLTIEVRLLSVD